MKAFLIGLWRRLRGTAGSPARAASAVALGLFIGCQPLYGLHLLLVLAVCLPLKLDAVLAYLAANVSNPFIAPLLLMAEVEAGSWLMTGQRVAFDVERARVVGAAGFAEQLLVGGVVIGALLATLGFGGAWLIAARRRASPPSQTDGAFEAAAGRARARYAQASRADRYYVAGKLAFDPVCRLVAGLHEPLGRVLDLGCGRGQLSLLLLELGLAASVTGFDSDPRKIAVASRAAPNARFEVADLAALSLPAADTVLLMDVLHYLPLREQDQLLGAVADCLAPGGRILVRELDAAGSLRSALTRASEWLARKSGLNRGRTSAYRPAAELVALLEQRGLYCELQGASERTPFANVLIVAGGSPRVRLEPCSSASSTRISAANA